MAEEVTHRWTRDTAVTHGRARVVDFVADALRHHGVVPRPLPVVVLTAPLGGGGSRTLDTLWAGFSRKSLSARVDVAKAQAVEDIVLAAVWGWRRPVRGIPPMRFPRTGMIFKALSFVVDDNGRAGFEEYLQAGPRDTAVNTVLRDWANRLAPLLPPDQQVIARIAAELLVILHSALGRRGNSEALQWLADYGGPDGLNGYDRLWELRRLQQQHTESSGRVVGKTLCAALLADIERAYARQERLRNALLLVDNADSAPGDLFLDLVVECRRESHGNARSAPDPVLVVAVQHRPVSTARMGPVVRSGDPALSVDRRPQAQPRWWVPVRLADLSRNDDVVVMCTSHTLGADYRDADFLHEVTGGHPESVDRLIDLLKDAPAVYSPRSLLTALVPGRHNWPPRWPPDAGTEFTVEDHLLKRTLPQDLVVLPDGRVDPARNPALDAMAVLTATPGLRLGACTAVFNSLRWANANAANARRRLVSGLWLEEGRDGEGQRLHPLIALLLRRWLARDPVVWRAVHAAYAAHYSLPADAGLRHRHNLALVEPSHREELSTVISHLERELDRAATTADWLGVLGEVTGAPSRVRTTGDPRSLVTTLAGVADSGDRRQSVTRLSVARWLFHDRVLDPEHRLAASIANEYERLAEFVADDEVLFTEAAKYRDIEIEWKRS